MGVCRSKEVQEQYAVNKQIEADIGVQKKAERSTVKLLLLGPGECGKSTILKQMRIIHQKGFSDSELTILSLSIYTNIIDSMETILNFMKREGMQFDDQELEVESEKFLNAADNQKQIQVPLYSCDSEICTTIKKLWADLGVQRAYQQKTELTLNDGTYYFFQNLDQICGKDYKPTQDDILRIRNPTTGAVEVDFEINKFQFRVFDVGGQLSERKKWIHIFDDVNAIIFIIALNDYDTVLREDSKVNRMDDAMLLFGDTINNQYFQNTLIILFLNKIDLFAEKITSVPINTAFPSYDGPQTYTDCLNYIRKQLLLLNKNETRQIKTHETCATDTNQVQVVMDSCINEIIEKMLSGFGDKHIETDYVKYIRGQLLPLNQNEKRQIRTYYETFESSSSRDKQHHGKKLW